MKKGGAKEKKSNVPGEVAFKGKTRYLSCRLLFLSLVGGEDPGVTHWHRLNTS